MENKIKSQIKAEINRRLVGTEIKYANLKRTLIRIFEWWHPGFKFTEPLNLADIPVNGPREVTVEFVLWGDLDWGDGNSQKKSISSNFGPIEISFSVQEYHLNFSKASFSAFEVG